MHNDHCHLVIKAARIICASVKDLSPQLALFCAGASSDDSFSPSMVETLKEELLATRHSIKRIEGNSDNVKKRAKILLCSAIRMPMEIDYETEISSPSALKNIEFSSTVSHIASCAGIMSTGLTYLSAWYTKRRKGLVPPVTSTECSVDIVKNKDIEKFLKFRQDFRKSELYRSGTFEDVCSNLETIIATGNDILISNESYQDWHRYSYHKQGPVSISNDKTVYSDMEFVYYTNEHDTCDSSLFRWPTITHNIKIHHVDKNRIWHEIYNDGINTDDFPIMQVAPKRRKIQSHGSVGTHYLKSMIQSAWERAVETASNTLVATTEHDRNDNSEFMSLRSMISQKNESILKCMQLQIHFQDIHVNNNRYKCEICKQYITFKSYPQVLTHLFGSADNRGCCWTLINYNEAIKSTEILEKESMNIVDSLLHPLLNAAKSDDKVSARVNIRKYSPSSMLITWKDVCDLYSNIISSSGDTAVNDNTVGESFDRTIKIHSTTLPIQLNHDMIQIVRQKLLDRYADLGNKKRK